MTVEARALSLHHEGIETSSEQPQEITTRIRRLLTEKLGRSLNAPVDREVLEKSMREMERLAKEMPETNMSYATIPAIDGTRAESHFYPHLPQVLGGSEMWNRGWPLRLPSECAPVLKKAFDTMSGGEFVMTREEAVEFLREHLILRQLQENTEGRAGVQEIYDESADAVHQIPITKEGVTEAVRAITEFWRMQTPVMSRFAQIRARFLNEVVAPAVAECQERLRELRQQSVVLSAEVANMLEFSTERDEYGRSVDMTEDGTFTLGTVANAYYRADPQVRMLVSTQLPTAVKERMEELRQWSSGKRTLLVPVPEELQEAYREMGVPEEQIPNNMNPGSIHQNMFWAAGWGRVPNPRERQADTGT